jgi:hypothetical protein
MLLKPKPTHASVFAESFDLLGKAFEQFGFLLGLHRKHFGHWQFGYDLI